MKWLSAALAFAGIANIVMLLLSRIMQPQNASELTIKRIAATCSAALLAIVIASFIDSRRFQVDA